MYDPDRSQAVRLAGEISDWPAFAGALRARLARHASDKGASMRLLSGRIASPTLLDQITKLLVAYPAMRWHVFEPTESRDSEAARAVYGRPLTLVPRLGDANVVVAFDAAPLGPGPDQVRFSRALGERRRRDRATTRLYAAECGMTLTGAFADHRLTAGPDELEAMIAALAAALGAPIAPPALNAEGAPFVDAVTKDLQSRNQGGLVLVGPTLTRARSLGVWINDRLSAPVDAFELDPRLAAASTIAELAADLAVGKVETLIVVDSNPVFSALGDLDFTALFPRADFRVHLGHYFDETAAASTWHLPAPHPLESWSDIAATDGMVSIIQPLIAPLYASISALGKSLTSVT